MYCAKCGSVVSNQAVYCPSCGASVKAASAESATPVSYATPVASTNLNGDHGNMSGKESPQTYNGNEAYIENKKKGARISGQILKWSAVIGVIGILLCIMSKGEEVAGVIGMLGTTGLLVAFISGIAYIGYTRDLPKEERTGTQKVALKVYVILGSIILFLVFGHGIFGIVIAIYVIKNFVDWNK